MKIYEEKNDEYIYIRYTYIYIYTYINTINNRNRIGTGTGTITILLSRSSYHDPIISGSFALAIGKPISSTSILQYRVFLIHVVFQGSRGNNMSVESAGYKPCTLSQGYSLARSCSKLLIIHAYVYRGIEMCEKERERTDRRERDTEYLYMPLSFQDHHYRKTDDLPQHTNIR